VSYEQRECPGCLGRGTVVEDARYDAATGELVQAVAVCRVCKGTGSVSVYLYSTARRRR